MPISSPIFLNADLGEGYAFDADIMPLIDIANIACGAHAGDKNIIDTCVALARQHNIFVSAHIGYDDKANFGRVTIQYNSDAFETLISGQIALLLDSCNNHGMALRHIKPHGALYHDLAKNTSLATQFVDICKKQIPAGSGPLIMIAPDGSALMKIAKASGLIVLNEAFADRRYGANGQLLARSLPDALITNHQQAVEQARSIAFYGTVRSNCGKTLAINAQTLCLHGDTDDALMIARAVSDSLRSSGS